MDHEHSCVATRSEYLGGRREARTGQREVVTHRVDVPTGPAEVDLPVDEYQRGAPDIENTVIGPGVGMSINGVRGHRDVPSEVVLYGVIWGGSTS